MNRIFVPILVSLMAVATLLAAPAPAEAVPCLPPTWYATTPEPPVEALDGGRLLVHASIETTFDALDPSQYLSTITATVARPDGTEPTSGTLTWEDALDAVVWTPDTPLPADASDWRATFVFDSTLLEGNCGPGFGMATVTFDFTVRQDTPTAVAPEPAVARLTETRQSVEQCCTTSAPELCYPDPSPCETCWAVDYDYAPTLVVTWTAAQDAALEPWVAYRVDRVEPDGTTTEVGTFQTPGSQEVPVVFDADADSYCARVVTLDLLAGTEVASAEVCANAGELVPITRDTPPDPPTDRCDGSGDDVAEGSDTSTGDTTSGDTSPPADDAQVVNSDEGCSCQVRAEPAPTPMRWPLWAAVAALGLFLVRRRRT